MRVLAVITDASGVTKILRHLIKIGFPPAGLDPSLPLERLACPKALFPPWAFPFWCSAPYTERIQGRYDAVLDGKREMEIHHLAYHLRGVADLDIVPA
jgi:hypothetical protein